MDFMHWNTWPALLALMPPPSQPGQPQPPFWTSLIPLILLLVIFYFLLIRPQQKRAKQHAELLKTLRPGDKILTSSGIYGVVLTVKEKTVTLRSADSKLEISKASVAEITERGGE